MLGCRSARLLVALAFVLWAVHGAPAPRGGEYGSTEDRERMHLRLQDRRDAAALVAAGEEEGVEHGNEDIAVDSAHHRARQASVRRASKGHGLKKARRSVSRREDGEVSSPYAMYDERQESASDTVDQEGRYHEPTGSTLTAAAPEVAEADSLDRTSDLTADDGVPDSHDGVDEHASEGYEAVRDPGTTASGSYVSAGAAHSSAVSSYVSAGAANEAVGAYTESDDAASVSGSYPGADVAVDNSGYDSVASDGYEYEASADNGEAPIAADQTAVMDGTVPMPSADASYIPSDVADAGAEGSHTAGDTVGNEVYHRTAPNTDGYAHEDMTAAAVEDPYAAQDTMSVAVEDPYAAQGTTSAAIGSSYAAEGTTSAAIGSSYTTEGTTSAAIGSSYTTEGSTSAAVGSSYGAEGTTSAAIGSSYGAEGTTTAAIGSSYGAEGTTSAAISSSYGAEGTTTAAIGSSYGAEGTTSTAIDSSYGAEGTTSAAIGNSYGAEGTTSAAIGSSYGAEGTTSAVIGSSYTTEDTTSATIGSSYTTEEASYAPVTGVQSDGYNGRAEQRPAVGEDATTATDFGSVGHGSGARGSRHPDAAAGHDGYEVVAVHLDGDEDEGGTSSSSEAVDGTERSNPYESSSTYESGNAEEDDLRVDGIMSNDIAVDSSSTGGEELDLSEPLDSLTPDVPMLSNVKPSEEVGRLSVTGFGFRETTTLVCRHAARNEVTLARTSIAEYVSSEFVLCELPTDLRDYPEEFEFDLEVSNDGKQFSQPLMYSRAMIESSFPPLFRRAGRGAEPLMSGSPDAARSVGIARWRNHILFMLVLSGTGALMVRSFGFFRSRPTIPRGKLAGSIIR